MKRPTWWGTPISTRRYLLSMVAVTAAALAAVWLDSIWGDGPVNWLAAIWGAIGTGIALTFRWAAGEGSSAPPHERFSEHSRE